MTEAWRSYRAGFGFALGMFSAGGLVAVMAWGIKRCLPWIIANW